MMRTVVAFDLDDTLVAEALFVRSGIRHIAGWLAERFPRLNPMLTMTCMEAAVTTRRNHYSALESLLERTGLTGEVDMRVVVDEFRNHMPDPEIYHMPPSTAGLLARLRERGITLALITDGRSLTQRNKIRAAGIDRLIDDSCILISEETGHDKKDPDNFTALMRKFDGTFDFHYVADNPEKDFIHPPRLGWTTHLVHPFPLAVHQGMPR